MHYRLAEEQDIDSICNLIKYAIAEMERNNIHQWDEIYPAKEDFLDDHVDASDIFAGALGGFVSIALMTLQ